MYQSSVRSATAGTGKTFLALFAVLSLLLSAFAMAAPVSAEHNPNHGADQHCPATDADGNFEFKDESGADDNDVVLDAGTTFCIKSSTGNTGILTADGETTLEEYLAAAGIVGGDGEGRDVSYYIVYTLPGLLVVDKQVTGEGASTTEGFQIHVTGQDSFMLSADGDTVPFGLAAGTTTAVSETLTAEQLAAGWSLVGIDCTTDLDDEAVLDADALTIGAGETVTCVVMNAFEAPQQQRGQIGIFKTMCEAIGQQDTCMGRDTSLDNYSVDFNVFAGTDITADPIETATVVLSENAEGEGNTGSGSQGRILTGELEAGTYTVCEVQVAYLLDDGIRVDEVELDVVPRPESGNGGSTGGNQTILEGTDCIVVEVTASGTAEVKFLDTIADVVQPELGAIIVAKATVAPTDEEFAFEFDGERFMLGSGDFETFDELPAGEYTVEELIGELDDDWSLEEIDCFVVDEASEFPAATAEISVTAGTAVIDLAEGQVVACIFLNEEAGELPTELGSITIVKVTVGAGGATTGFDFEITSPDGSDLPAEFSLMGGTSRVFSGLDAGSYAFAEEVTAGWRLAALRCTAGGSVDLATRTATVTLEEGAAVTCVFTNVAAEGQLPGGPGPVAPKPREGQLPNTSVLAEPSGSVPAALLALVMLTGLGAAGYAMQAEARRRR